MGCVRWAAAILVALVACTNAPTNELAQTSSWDAPPARWVSDLGPFDKRSTYNETSSVGDNGRWVVFSSRVGGVGDRPLRLFLVDTKRQRVRQIDDSFDGGPRESKGVGRYNVAGLGPQISPNGRFVVFSAAFSNIVRGDTNRATDIFVFDRITQKTRLVTRSTQGEQANGDSDNPAISADGRFVVFDSRATNLSPQDTDRRSDVFLRDLETGRTDLISVGPNGEANGWSFPDVSDDGNRVSFTSDASNLVDSDTNHNSDVFVRDLASSSTVRVSVTTSGEEYESFESCESASCYDAGVGGSRISGNGDVVVFSGNANGLVEDDVNYNDDIFTHVLTTGVTERVSVRSDGGDAYGPESTDCGKDPVCAQFTHSPSISQDGTLVYFISAAPLISDEDNDGEPRGTEEQVFVRDRIHGVTLLVSRYRDGSPVHSANWSAGEISADGRWITYSNNSMRLDGPHGDQEPNTDVFLQRLP